MIQQRKPGKPDWGTILLALRWCATGPKAEARSVVIGREEAKAILKVMKGADDE